jgi:epoxyqueuosine reductase QueG
VERRRAGRTPPPDATPHVSLVDWLAGDGDELVRAFDRLYVPRNDPRFLRRNALVAVGNGAGGEGARHLAERYAASDDELLREHAEWALARLEDRRAD